MTGQVEVQVKATFEVAFRLPPGMGGLELVRHHGFGDPDEYELRVQVAGDSVEEAQARMREFRQHLVELLQQEES